MIKAIIFDCFGVLAEDGWLPFKRKYIGDNQELAQTVADLGKQNEYGYIDYNQYLEQSASLIKVSVGELSSALGRKVPNIELFEFIKNDLKPSYKIGLMSNANYDVVHELFTPDQASVFDAVVLSYESKLIKPDERMYRQMAELLAVQNEECIYIDDIERYCVAAEEYGMTSILYESPDQVKQKVQSILAVN